jgi:hypothetical protein
MLKACKVLKTHENMQSVANKYFVDTSALQKIEEGEKKPTDEKGSTETILHQTQREVWALEFLKGQCTVAICMQIDPLGLEYS